MLIPSCAIVSSLARKGPVHNCDACGERMFVRTRSGLCPPCWNSRQFITLDDDLEALPDELCLAGILEGTDEDEIA